MKATYVLGSSGKGKTRHLMRLTTSLIAEQKTIVFITLLGEDVKLTRKRLVMIDPVLVRNAINARQLFVVNMGGVNFLYGIRNIHVIIDLNCPKLTRVVTDTLIKKGIDIISVTASISTKDYYEGVKVVEGRV